MRGNSLVCKNGHLREENTNGRGRCKLCRAEAERKRRRDKKQGVFKPQSEFPKGYCLRGHERTPENLYAGGACKQCAKQSVRKRYAANPESYWKQSRAWVAANPERNRNMKSDWDKKNPDKTRAFRKKYRYNMTMEEFQERLTAQEGKCPLCLSELLDFSKTVVDHDHRCCTGAKICGKCIRGLLCKPCNWALGHLKDNVDTLKRAIEYLERYESLVH